MDAGKFPSPKTDIIFIAGSSDVRQLRAACEKSIDAIIARLSPEETIEPYSWDIAKQEDSFDQRLRMQEDLPLPSDPRCRGVICLLGERLGYPIDDGFVPDAYIPDIDAWCSDTRRYRLLHPWPHALEMQAQMDALAAGCFPLTGTVFEFLVARAHGKKMHLCLVSDKEIAPGDDSARLGDYRLRESHSRDTNFEEWYRQEWIPQTMAVRNFMCAIAGHGLHQVVSLDFERHKNEVEKFIAGVLKVGFTHLNPYLSLNYFDVDDATHYYGREEQSRAAVRELMERFTTAGKPRAIRITGDSGSGKTSLLRAGVLAELGRLKHRGDIRTIVFHRTDFHGNDGLPGDVILLLLKTVHDRGVLDIPLDVIRKVERARLRAPAVAMAALHALLPAASDGGKSKLVIGLDQFEEIVDDMSSGELRRSWLPLIEFVQASTGNTSIGFVYTLESSRRGSFDSLDLPDAFRDRYELKISDSDENFLSKVIEIPFKMAGFDLSDRITRELLDNVERAIRDDTGRRFSGSVLPLLALKLTNLFDYVQDSFGHRRRADREGLRGDFHELLAIDREELDYDLGLKTEIATLAESAWREGAGDEREDPEALDHFLQPLIRVPIGQRDATPESVKLTLETIGRRPYSDERRIDESFSSMRHRLLLPAGNRWRLVHEAVIRHWPRARLWLGRELGFLCTEARFLHEAALWHDDGRGDDLSQPAADRLDAAAHILNKYLRAWALGNDVAINENEALIRDYALAIFSHSSTPLRPVPGSPERHKRHVHLAANYGLVSLLERFRDIDADSLDAGDDRGNTPLMCAAWSQADAVAWLLEEAGADPVHENTNGWRAISAPVQMDRMDIFEQLLPRYSAETLACPEGQTYLHTCAVYNRVEMATDLVRRFGLDPAAPDDYQRTPMQVAASCGHLQAFEYFRQFTDAARSDRWGYTALHWAAQEGHLPVVEAILNERDCKPCFEAVTTTGFTPLLLAAQYRRADVAAALLDVSDDPNARCAATDRYAGYTALHLAISGPPESGPEDHASREAALKTVGVLLSHADTDPNIKADGRSPFALASLHPGIRRRLLEDPRLALSEPSDRGWTPLMFAARTGERDIVERILASRGVNVSHIAGDGTSAASLMVKAGMADLVEDLVNGGRFDPWAAGQKGGSLLAVAITANEAALVDSILERFPGMVGDHVQALLDDALRHALTSRNGATLIERLFDLGANPNVEVSDSGETALFIAAALGQLDTVEKILANPRTNPAILDSWNRTPADYAPDRSREAIAERVAAACDRQEAGGRARADRTGAASDRMERGHATADILNNPLVQAAFLGRLDTFESLLDSPDTDPTWVDDWGRSPADFAPDAMLDAFRRKLARAVASLKGGY